MKSKKYTRKQKNEQNSNTISDTPILTNKNSLTEKKSQLLKIETPRSRTMQSKH